MIAICRAVALFRLYNNVYSLQANRMLIKARVLLAENRDFRWILSLVSAIVLNIKIYIDSFVSSTKYNSKFKDTKM